MQIDVGTSISRLLYEHDKVIIPNFGSLIATYRHATVDQVQGVFSPPAKDLVFNSNLITNDGLLINYIKSKYNISFGEAEKIVSDFVENSKTALDKRENIVIPEVGKLYRDYENKIQFISDNNNFNSQSYGLPPVQFYPILRDREPNQAGVGSSSMPKIASTTPSAKIATASASTTTAATDQIPTETDKEISYYFQKALPFLAGLAILIVALSIYVVASKDNNTRINDGSQLAESVEEAQIRINQKPSAEEDEEDYTEEGIILEDESAAPVDTEGETLAPNQKECIIIIGGFKNKRNIQKLVEKLYEAGYDAYTDQKNGITRVGAMFAYTDEREVDRKLEDVKRKFERKAWILPPEERLN